LVLYFRIFSTSWPTLHLKGLKSTFWSIYHFCRISSSSSFQARSKFFGEGSTAAGFSILGMDSIGFRFFGEVIIWLNSSEKGFNSPPFTGTKSVFWISISLLGIFELLSLFGLKGTRASSSFGTKYLLDYGI